MRGLPLPRGSLGSGRTLKPSCSEDSSRQTQRNKKADSEESAQLGPFVYWRNPSPLFAALPSSSAWYPKSSQRKVGRLLFFLSLFSPELRPPLLCCLRNLRSRRRRHRPLTEDSFP